jgi:hypothetical protein
MGTAMPSAPAAPGFLPAVVLQMLQCPQCLKVAESYEKRKSIVPQRTLKLDKVVPDQITRSQSYYN